MADDSPISFVLDLDADEFVESAESALGAIESINNSDLSGLVSNLGSIIEVLGTVGLAVEAFKLTMDLTLEGEQIQRTEAYFQQLAAQAGISGEALKTGLEQASGGLIPLNDLLGIANKAIIAMGASASQLPAVLELARKAAQVTGEDVTTVFQGMVDSIEHANTRMLKHYGIVIDQNEAYQKMADQLGVTKNELSEAGKQQAILNATLEQGQKALGGVQLTTSGATEAVQSFKAAWIEVKETVATILSSVLGPQLTSFFHGLADMAKDARTHLLAAFGKGDESDTAKLTVLQSKLMALKGELVDIDTKSGEWAKKGWFMSLFQGDPDKRAAELKKQIAELEPQIAALQKSESKNVAISQEVTQADTESTKQRLINQEQLRKDNEKFHADMLKLNEQEKQDRLKQQQEILKATEAENKVELLNVNSTDQIKKEIDRQDVLRKQQSAQTIDKINEEYSKREIQRQQEIAKAKQQYSADDTRREQEINAINAKYAHDDETRTRLVELEKERYRQQELQSAKIDEKTKEQLDQQYLKNSTSTYEGVSRAAKVQADKSRAELMDYGKLGNETYTDITKVATSGFAAIGTAMVANKNIAQAVADAMKKAALEAIGKEATERGTLLLLSSVWPPNPVGIAAGGALIAFGSAVSALAGASSSSVSGGGAGGGGGKSDYGSTTGTSPTQAAAAQTDQSQQLQQQQQVQRTVSINIAGNYLNSQESQRTLMEIMRNEVDSTGFQYNKIGI